jgi:hypothetical protein
MTTKTHRIALVAALAATLLVAPRARAVIGPSRAPIRLMTYNTALMNLEATLQAGAAPLDISLDVNKDGFGGQPYDDRVSMISSYIKDEDPDVVVLNEVWNDDQKNKFVEYLTAPNGPYDSYIKKIKGKAPGLFNPLADPGLKVENVISLFAKLIGCPAGQTVDAFLSANLCPFLPPGFCPITDVDIHMQDSGIMLFSKHQFVEFDSANFPHPPKGLEIEGVNGFFGPAWGVDPQKHEVAVAVYKVARGMDELASKAAGMVRIQVAPNSIADVVFSHTNADETGPEENADVRAVQMNHVKSIVTDALTPAELAAEQVYMLGDLNTPGHNKKTGTVEEWSTLFGNNAVNSTFKDNPGVFFACGDATQCTAAIPGQKLNLKGTFFTDSWGFETSTADESKSNYIDGQYYDYVLHNKPERQCMQYIRIGAEMKDWVNSEQLSDHLPIHVDFNLTAPRCTPNLDDPNGAEKVDLTSDHHVETFNQNRQARITHPGSMQWYYLPEPGTYWINIVDGADHVAFDVYNDFDLSDPLPPYHGETDARKGKRYVSYNPLYVRVYAVDQNRKPDRNWVGPYAIQLWRAMGATPDDSIGITPAVPWDYAWVSQGTDQPRVWFDFYTDQTRSLDFAHTTLVNETRWAGDPQPKWNFSNELWVQTGPDPLSMQDYTDLTPLLDQANPPPDGFKNFVNPDPNLNPNAKVTGWQVEMPELEGTPTNVGHGPKKYYYVLTQDGTYSPLPQALHSTLTLLTDLQYLIPVGFQSTGSLYSSKENLLFGFSFDGVEKDYCIPQFPGDWNADCIDIVVKTPGVLNLPADYDGDMKGPFKATAMPTAWIGVPPAPPTQIGHDGDGGSDIQEISIARGTVGMPNCVNNDAVLHTLCYDMPMSSPNSPNVYSYHLFYGIAHDLPYAQP